MAANKTQPTDAKVADYLAAIEDETRRADCETLVKLMSKVTKQPPVMWGPSMVGFGTYHYKYESGREGDFFLTGFASRKSDISVYLSACDEDRDELLAQLGKHKMGKGCLYLKRLSDVDVKVLEKLIKSSIAETKRRYG